MQPCHNCGSDLIPMIYLGNLMKLVQKNASLNQKTQCLRKKGYKMIRTH